MTATDFNAARSGVYRTPVGVERLRESARAARLAWIEVDLTHVGSKAELLAAVATVCAFPAGFGHNWDALADSLADFSWLPAAGYVLAMPGSAAARRALGADWNTFLEVLRAAARYWQARGKVFIALIDDAMLPEWR